MSRTSFVGYLRQYGSNKKSATPAVFEVGIKASFDPTSGGQIKLGTLPKGAIPLPVFSFGGATGGTNPTVDIGTSVDPDGLANELAADGNFTGGSAGDLAGIELLVDTDFFGQVGASAATGGTTTVFVRYIMADDGKA